MLLLASRLHYFRAIAFFCPAAVQSTSGLCRIGMGVSSARAREYACRGLYLHAALALVKPSYESLPSGAFIRVADVG